MTIILSRWPSHKILYSFSNAKKINCNYFYITVKVRHCCLVKSVHSWWSWLNRLWVQVLAVWENRVPTHLLPQHSPTFQTKFYKIPGALSSLILQKLYFNDFIQYISVTIGIFAAIRHPCTTVPVLHHFFNSENYTYSRLNNLNSTISRFCFSSSPDTA